MDGVHVTILTDHAPLEYIRAKTDRCKRLERWALRLQEFRFTIQPRQGSRQKHLDTLSRALILVEPGQQPVTLDEYPDRVVLFLRAWEELRQPGHARPHDVFARTRQYLSSVARNGRIGSGAAKGRGAPYSVGMCITQSRRRMWAMTMIVVLCLRTRTCRRSRAQH